MVEWTDAEGLRVKKCELSTVGLLEYRSAA